MEFNVFKLVQMYQEVVLVLIYQLTHQLVSTVKSLKSYNLIIKMEVVHVLKDITMIQLKILVQFALLESSYVNIVIKILLLYVLPVHKMPKRYTLELQLLTVNAWKDFIFLENNAYLALLDVKNAHQKQVVPNAILI